MFYEFFGENTLRSDISVSVGKVGSLLDHTGPIAAGERNAARIFGTDETLFVVGGNSTSNKIVWHGMVGRGDLVLCDRNCHKSILHSLIMTGATPIYLIPSRNGLGIIGPISKDQFTPEAIKAKIAASPFAQETSGKVRLMVVTNSTYDGLCYNVDGIKASLGDAVDVLHFDEAWYAYANFHPFYDGYHAISSTKPARSKHAITFATQSSHKLLAAFSQASMIHVQNAEAQVGGHDALQRRLHDAHLDLAAIRHHRLARRGGGDDGTACRAQSLVQETIDEALAFRHAMQNVRDQLDGGWWFDIWQPEGILDKPAADHAQLVADAGRQRGTGSKGLAAGSCDGRSDQGHDPDARPVGRWHACRRTGIPAAVVVKFLSARRIEIEKTGLYSFLILFSMGITKGKWSTLITELLNFKEAL